MPAVLEEVIEFHITSIMARFLSYSRVILKVQITPIGGLIVAYLVYKIHSGVSLPNRGYEGIYTLYGMYELRFVEIAACAQL